MHLEGTKTRNRDIYRSFYTKDERLVDYMVRLLDVKDGDECLEPAAGDGCFIDGLLRTHRRITIEAWELSEEESRSLRSRYTERDTVRIVHDDFLSDGTGIFSSHATFDKVVGNPPYGGWQDYSKRNWLKTQFPTLYVRETYGLFLAKGLLKLRPHGRLVFIVPETFLYLHMQKALREFILRKFTVVSIDILPSSLFPGVSFGYAKLCIIVIDNRPPISSHRIAIRHCETVEALVLDVTARHEVLQISVLNRLDYAFPLSGQTPAAKLIDAADFRLGDAADCVTGIYTGNDSAFLRAASINARGAKKYQEVEDQVIVPIGRTQPSLNGYPDRPCFIPLLKGGGISYFKPVCWYIDWSEEAVRHYKKDKKARFQNSDYYFRRGIGFPMVTSTRATASVILENWLFDQSIVGVFPRNPAMFGFLLAFLNSRTCWKLLREINPSANNSAKYLKKLPLILPSSGTLQEIDTLVTNYIDHLRCGEEHDLRLEQQLDKTVQEIYSSKLEAE